MNVDFIHLAETDSTNRWLREHGMPGQGQLVVVDADYQHRGQGCGTNTWESEQGKNLLFSIAWQPDDIPPARQFSLSMAEALATLDALQVFDNDICLKWPNDIYWHDRKLGGTLIETTLQGGRIQRCIWGTGINLMQTTFPESLPNPVSLSQITGNYTDKQQLLRDIVQRLILRLEQLRQGQYEMLKSDYLSHLYRMMQWSDYLIGQQPVTGRITGIDDNGHLQMELRRGAGIERHSFDFKEIAYII